MSPENNSKKPAVIFDWSGTLADNFGDFCIVVNGVLDRFGAQRISNDEIRQEFTIPYMRFWNKYLPNVTKEEQAVVFKEKVKDLDLSKPFPGLIETFETLSKRGHPLYVISSDYSPRLENEAKKFGIFKYIDSFVTGVHEKDCAIRNLVESYNLHPQKTFYVGDSDGDILAGKRAHIRTIAKTGGFNDYKKLMSAKPDILIHNICDLPRAIDYLLTN